MQKPLGFLALVAAFAAASWLGWWMIPFTAALFGALRPAYRRPALVAGLAAALAWAGWLLDDLVSGRGAFAVLAGRLSGIMSMPPVLLIVATLAFATLLAWSAAAIAGALAGSRRLPGGGDRFTHRG